MSRWFATPLRAWQAAGAVLLVLVGLAGGWLLHDLTRPGPMQVPNYIEQAVAAHAAFAHELRYPDEVPTTEQLAERFAGRLGASVQVPDFTKWGFVLVGGRLLSGLDGPAAQLMYEDPARRRVSLYVRSRVTDADTPRFQIVEDGGVTALSWNKGNLSFALTGSLQRSELLGIARAAYGAPGRN